MWTPDNQVRWYVRDGKIYVIRDRWIDAKNVIVEYGVTRGVEIEWKPTIEGALFAGIEPVGEVI